MNKLVYHITSLHKGTPSYRVYDYAQAQDLFMTVREQWPDNNFWLDKQEREARDGSI